MWSKAYAQVVEDNEKHSHRSQAIERRYLLLAQILVKTAGLEGVPRVCRPIRPPARFVLGDYPGTFV
jgi:hypothetical protein